MNRHTLARYVLTPLALAALTANLVLLVLVIATGFTFALYIAGAILLVFAAICGAFASTWWDYRAPFNLDVLNDRSPVRLSDDTE